MSALAELQADVMSWIRSQDPGAAARIGAGPGLDIYLNNHRSSLMAALRESYALLRTWLGEAEFDLAAAHYISANDPVSWTLDAYGARFAETLAELHPGAPVAADLARLEWALGQAFISGDAPVLDPAGLAHVDWERAEIRLPPGARRVSCETNADAILAALADDTPPPAPTPAPGAPPVLVWRRGLAPRFRRLGPEEARLADRLAAGVAFAEVCADLADAVGEVEAVSVAGGLLATWAAEGLILAEPLWSF